MNARRTNATRTNASQRERLCELEARARSQCHRAQPAVSGRFAQVKQRRLREVVELFNAGAREGNEQEVGREHLVLVDSLSKRSESEWAGRTDNNKRVVFARRPLPAAAGCSEERELQPGDYVAVRISQALSPNTLRGEPLARTSIAEFAERRNSSSQCSSE